MASTDVVKQQAEAAAVAGNGSGQPTVYDLIKRQRAGIDGIPLAHLNWEAGGEAGNALQLPSFRQPWHGVEDALKRHLPNVADHEVVVHVARRKAAAKLGVLEIDQVAKT